MCVCGGGGGGGSNSRYITHECLHVHGLPVFQAANLKQF